MKYKQARQLLFYGTILTVAILFFCDSAMALNWDFNNGMVLDLDVTTGYAAGIRTGNRDHELWASNVNADDGSYNFDQWDMINNRFSIIADLDFNYLDSYGVFVRPRAFYDFAYMSNNSNNHPTTNNNFVAGVIDNNDEWPDEVESAHGQNAEILDAFAYAGFDVGGGRYIDLRAGRQAIQWGESLFLQGGIASAMAYLDVTASNAPGTEVKEILLPSGSASVQMDLTQAISVGGFYQWEWEKHRLNESGSFFTDKDFLDEAGYVYLYEVAPGTVIPVMERRKDLDKEPDDQGQYGFNMMYRASWLGETEFGLYYINYHEKLPTFNPDVANGRYFITYGEDVKLYGFSVSSQVGPANVSGELSYRQDFPVATTDPVDSIKEADYWQAQVSWLYYTPIVPGIDNFGFLGEVGCNHVQDFTDEDLSAQDKHKFSWGFTAVLKAEWYQILPDLDLAVPIAYKGNPEGNSVNTLTFDEKNDSGSIGLEFTYKNTTKATFKYVNYFDSIDNSYSDRDYVTFDIKYTF